MGVVQNTVHIPKDLIFVTLDCEGIWTPDYEEYTQFCRKMCTLENVFQNIVTVRTSLLPLKVYCWYKVLCKRIEHRWKQTETKWDEQMSLSSEKNFFFFFFFTCIAFLQCCWHCNQLYFYLNWLCLPKVKPIVIKKTKKKTYQIFDIF